MIAPQNRATTILRGLKVWWSPWSSQWRSRKHTRTLTRRMVASYKKMLFVEGALRGSMKIATGAFPVYPYLQNHQRYGLS